MCIRDRVWSRGTLPIASRNGGRTSRENTNKCNNKRSNWKANYGCRDKTLACSWVNGSPCGNVTEDRVMHEVVDENQSDLDQLMGYRSSVHGIPGMIPAKLAVERQIRIPGYLLFGSPKTEFKELQNYSSHLDQLPRLPCPVLLQEIRYQFGMNRHKERAVLQQLHNTLENFRVFYTFLD